MRYRLLMAFLVALAVWPVQAFADTTWDHNGSVMVMREDGDSVTITYDEPRTSIRKQGVRRGTVLFEGMLVGSGRLSGTAYVFRQGCEPAPYDASGAYRSGSGQDRLILNGDAPVRVSGGCRVTGYVSSGSNARLVFTLIGSDGHSDAAPEGEDSSGDGAGLTTPPGRITCPSGKAWNGSRCVQVSDPSLLDANGQPLDGYYMDENGNILQDNGGGE